MDKHGNDVWNNTIPEFSLVFIKKATRINLSWTWKIHFKRKVDPPTKRNWECLFYALYHCTQQTLFRDHGLNQESQVCDVGLDIGGALGTARVRPKVQVVTLPGGSRSKVQIDQLAPGPDVKRLGTGFEQMDDLVQNLDRDRGGERRTGIGRSIQVEFRKVCRTAKKIDRLYLKDDLIICSAKMFSQVYS